MLHGNENQKPDQVHNTGCFRVPRIYDGNHRFVVTPKLQAFSREKGVPYSTCDDNREKFLPFDTDPPILIQTQVGRPATLEPLSPEKPPKPDVLGASVNSSKSGAGVVEDSRKKERPFHFVIKTLHMTRSLKNSLLSLTW